MSRPPNNRPPPDPQGNLVELPQADERAPEPGQRLADEPAPIAAWLDHASSDDLHERLTDLARELAEGPGQTQAPSRRRWLPWIAVAAAALTLIALGARALISPSPQPIADIPQPAAHPEFIVPQLPIPADDLEPPVLVEVEPAPAPAPPPRLQPRSLESSDPSKPLQIVAGVEVLLHGHILLTGTPRAPRLVLQGSAVIDVVPGSVDSLELDSVAAQVSVLGTRFAVEEGATATTVRVERGKVAVQCRTGQQARLIAGQQLECPNANGLYMQAKLLQRQGAPAQDLLPVVESALAFPDYALHSQLEAMHQELEDTVAQQAVPRENEQELVITP
jgi:hypothetical protein